MKLLYQTKKIQRTDGQMAILGSVAIKIAYFFIWTNLKKSYPQFISSNNEIHPYRLFHNF